MAQASFGGMAVRQTKLVLSIFAAAAYATQSRPTPVPPPAYPWSGFGRIGCYAGPSLTRMASTTALPPDAEVRGPWLVLDSLSPGELRVAGYRDADIHAGNISAGSLLERRDTIERTSGAWHRATPDSIIFEEGTTFPAVTWHFRLAPDGLVGEGVLVHDFVTVSIDTGSGTASSHLAVSRWPVHVRRIDCAAVPVQIRRPSNER